MTKTMPITNQNTEFTPIISEKTYSRVSTLLKIAVFLLVFFAWYAVLGIALVPSESMEPTLNVGDRFAYTYATASDLTYDDIVVFFPFAEMDKPVSNGVDALIRIRMQKDTVFVKRIIGLPGDVLAMKDGYVYRNGEKLDPDYIAEDMITNGQTYVVPEGTIFCMGDNRNNSNDSRYMGAYPMNNFFGKLVAHF
ncbi:MAG: signal peptidase I [Acetatifactor sp.]|jgi:signal peptidase I|nr:signal peptidase I [Acetatifactor sp.]